MIGLVDDSPDERLPGAEGRIRAVMPKDVTLRPFYLLANGAFGVMITFTADRDLFRWIAIGVAAFSFTAAGWFFREVWQARQSNRSSGETVGQSRV